MTSTQFLEVAISISVQVALLVLAAEGIGRSVRGNDTRCRLWALCYVAILLVLGAGLLLPHPRLARPWAAVHAEIEVAVVSTEQFAGGVLLTVWLTGAAVSLAGMIVGTFRATRFLRTCTVLPPDRLPPGARDSAGAGRRGRPVRFLTSDRIAGPFCWHFHRPAVVLPDFTLQFDPAKLAAILRHELKHLDGGHPLQLFVQRLVEIVFWFHPLVWWASRRAALAREFACDDAAVDTPADVVNYLRCLLAIAEKGSAEGGRSPASLFFGRDDSLIALRARRLVALAETCCHRKTTPVLESAALVGLLAVAFLIGSLWLPVDALASPRARWSPWPRWTAGALHDLGIPVRDFEAYHTRVSLEELREACAAEEPRIITGSRHQSGPRDRH
ncbi:MAG: M56 family metallopeptidase [Rhodopirellula sp.]|nr:M56 family metallopeptidase [Rhodopirellula sp.]